MKNTDIEKPPKTIKTWAKVLIVVLCVAVLLCVAILIMKPWEKIQDPDTSDRIDLTQLSGNMVYAQVNDMVNTRPKKYLGKAIKIRGQYRVGFYTATGQYINYVFVPGADACCPNGLEFTYDDGSLPNANATITVEGTFERYFQGGNPFYYIKATSLTA